MIYGSYPVCSEAPVNGYMFGKGIVIVTALLLLMVQYLANMASKSAIYCGFGESKGHGLLLLCEAQLGNPLYECKHADGYAAENCLGAVMHVQTSY
jgi:poly [ADP-ribose] polymerase 2/3/4